MTAAPAAALLLLLLELLVAAAGPAFVYAPQLGADPFTRLCLCLWTRFSLGTLAHFHLQLLYPPLWDVYVCECVCAGGGGERVDG